jgi:hypothetical protein
MLSIQQSDMDELRKQLANGAIQKAYRALISFMLGLRTFFANKYGEAFVSSLYQGYMDMTYFALFPPALKLRNLKVAIVFNYNAFRFEVWLTARNRKVQRAYWELFRDSQWAEYRVVAPAEGIDSIVECDVTADLDFIDLDTLTSKIENTTAVFIENMESFLSEHQFVAG